MPIYLEDVDGRTLGPRGGIVAACEANPAFVETFAAGQNQVPVLRKVLKSIFENLGHLRIPYLKN